jgi:hypothetical protein
MRRFLVVANQTLGGDALLRRVREAVSWGPSSFHLLVPATPVRHQLTWTEGEAQAVARQRLDEGLARFETEGFNVSGEVGDANPMLAIADALRDGNFDEVILSTLPVGVSRWVRMDLPSRVHRRFGLPVTHVIADTELQTS